MKNERENEKKKNCPFKIMLCELIFVHYRYFLTNYARFCFILQNNLLILLCLILYYV